MQARPVDGSQTMRTHYNTQNHLSLCIKTQCADKADGVRAILHRVLETLRFLKRKRIGSDQTQIGRDQRHTARRRATTSCTRTLIEAQGRRRASTRARRVSRSVVTLDWRETNARREPPSCKRSAHSYRSFLRRRRGCGIHKSRSSSKLRCQPSCCRVGKRQTLLCDHVWKRGPSPQSGLVCWKWKSFGLSKYALVCGSLSRFTFVISQRWPESLFQTPTPLLFQNFWIRVRIWVRQFFNLKKQTPVQTPAAIIDSTVIYPCFYNKTWPRRLLLLMKLKSDSGSVFLQIFDSGYGSRSKRKTQNPAGVDSGPPNPVPPMVSSKLTKYTFHWQKLRNSFH